MSNGLTKPRYSLGFVLSILIILIVFIIVVEWLDG